MSKKKVKIFISLNPVEMALPSLTKGSIKKSKTVETKLESSSPTTNSLKEERILKAKKEIVERKKKKIPNETKEKRNLVNTKTVTPKAIKNAKT